MGNILLTGFQPFGGLKDNPSARIVEAMENTVTGGHRIVARTLPVTFKDAPERIGQLISEFKPVLVISLGLAGGEAGIRLEQQAINHVDFRIPDNAGEIARGCIEDGGPESYQSDLPLTLILQALQHNNIPARISDSAGTFVCNALMYSALKLCNHNGNTIPCGFIHLPYLPEQVSELQHPVNNTEKPRAASLDGTSDGSANSMPLAMQIEAVQLSIKICVGKLAPD